MENVTILAAFLAGFLSFVSPCVLPLVPGYLAYVSGMSLDEIHGGRPVPPSRGVHRRVLTASLAFAVGFSLIFIAIGASATSLGQFLLSRQLLFARMSGGLVILVGFHTMGVLRIDRLTGQRPARTPGLLMPASVGGALLLGVAFVFGWTPCIGPVLTAILFVGGAEETVGEGVTLLSVYSAGLAVPFLATSLAVERLVSLTGAVRRHERALAAVSGVLLILLGSLIFTGRVTVIAQFLTRFLPVY